MHISTKCSVALHCLVFIHEYGNVARVTSQLLSASTGINSATIRAIISSLKKAGILDVRPGTGGATLATPPERITVLDVTEALEPDFLTKLIGVHAAPSQECPVGRNIHAALDQSYEKVRQDMKRSLADITLADVLADYRAALGQEGRTDVAPQQGEPPA